MTKMHVGKSKKKLDILVLIKLLNNIYYIVSKNFFDAFIEIFKINLKCIHILVPNVVAQVALLRHAEAFQKK